MFYSYLIGYLYIGALAGLFFLGKLLGELSFAGFPTTEKERAAAQLLSALQEAFDLGAWLGALMCLLCALWALYGALTVAVLWPVWVWKGFRFGPKN